MSQEFSFSLSFDDFELSLFGEPQPALDSEEFRTKVSEFFVRQFIGLGGAARVVLNDQEREIKVVWTKSPDWDTPKEKALDLLNTGQIEKALPILWTLLHKDPSDAGTLFRLGLAYNELGQYSKAAEILQRLIDVEPDHVHGLTALGVAELAAGNLLIAEEWLRKARNIDSYDRWVLRNLSACLLKQNRFEDAIPVIQKCLTVAPDDIAMMVGLGEALDALGRTTEAEQQYRAAIRTGGPEHVVDVAKERLTERSKATFRSGGPLRLDAVQYIRDALSRFNGMTEKEIQSLALELAMLGNQGLDINDSTKKYEIKSLAGEFSGLNLISIMYAAFQQFAPGQDVGIDLSKEYEIAKAQS
jgi:tetratricopeptide (TPR) repeat protein